MTQALVTVVLAMGLVTLASRRMQRSLDSRGFSVTSMTSSVPSRHCTQNRAGSPCISCEAARTLMRKASVPSPLLPLTSCMLSEVLEGTASSKSTLGKPM